MYLCVPISKGYPGQIGGITKSSLTIINMLLNQQNFSFGYVLPKSMMV